MMPLTENGRNARVCGYSTMVVQQPSKLLEPAQIPTMRHAKQRLKLAFGIKRLGFGSKTKLAPARLPANEGLTTTITGGSHG